MLNIFLNTKTTGGFAGLLLWFAASTIAHAANIEQPGFDDSPLEEDIILPDWFKLSFLELKNDLDEARENHKQGIIIYFGMKHCPYCKAHLENNWGQKDIVHYTRKNFDVIAIDVKGNRMVTDFNNQQLTEKVFAAQHKTNFTPSLMFINTEGKEVLRLRGYRPPYQFRAALEYVADQHYRRESFRDYLARAEAAGSYGKEGMNENKNFARPPYLLDRSKLAAERPLLVTFERPRCHACDVLHGGPLQHPEIIQRLSRLEAVQLNIESDTPVITPSGQRLTAKQWAKQLQIDYTPTIIFFDQHGKEIIRIDSVVWFYRLRNVLDYVLSDEHKQYPTFQMWRQAKKIR